MDAVKQSPAGTERCCAGLARAEAGQATVEFLATAAFLVFFLCAAYQFRSIQAKQVEHVVDARNQVFQEAHASALGPTHWISRTPEEVVDPPFALMKRIFPGGAIRGPAGPTYWVMTGSDAGG